MLHDKLNLETPGFSIPNRMLGMNYGCGTTVNPRDLSDNHKFCTSESVEEWKFVSSDPICDDQIPDNLRDDDRLRVLCMMDLFLWMII